MIDFVRKGKNTSDATATPSDILSPKTAYVDNEKVTGNIITTTLPSSLTLVDEEKNITAANNNILDYFVLDEEEFVISSSTNINMTSIAIQNSATQNTIIISDIENGCVLLCARLFDFNIIDEIGMLVVVQNTSTKKISFGVVALNTNNLQINNIYTTEVTESLGSYSDFICNIVYNDIKNCFSVLIKSSDSGNVHTYILNCTKGNIQQLSYNARYLRAGFQRIETLIDVYWNDSGTALLIRAQYNRLGNVYYQSYILKYNESLSTATYISVWGESQSTQPYQFLNDDYIISGDNQIYKINENNVSLQETISNININNKNVYDKIIVLNNCFYLYFSVNNSKIYVYKYDTSFNFTLEKEISWAINSTNAAYSFLMYCPAVINNVIKYNESNKIKEIYATTNSPDFASLERNNIKYFNTSDADATAADVSFGKIAYGASGKITGTGTILNGQTKTITPSTSQQLVVPDSSYNALTSVTVNAVDSSIDNNIVAENIRSGVTILGKTGTYTGETNNVVEEENGND